MPRNGTFLLLLCGVGPPTRIVETTVRFLSTLKQKFKHQIRFGGRALSQSRFRRSGLHGVNIRQTVTAVRFFSERNQTSLHSLIKLGGITLQQRRFRTHGEGGRLFILFIVLFIRSAM